MQNTNTPPQVSFPIRLGIGVNEYRLPLWQFGCALRVAMPGIVQSFDADTQLAVVRIAVREVTVQNQQLVVEQIPDLADVPIVLPHGGGYGLTIPVQAGDECLLIFADTCIDSWWQAGKVQNQLFPRRHSLADPLAMIGCWSKPNVITDYDPSNLQLRSDDGSVVITLNADTKKITVAATTGEVDVTAATVNIAGATTVNITGGTLNVSGSSVTIGTGTTIDGRVSLAHEHSGVTPGGGMSGPVV